MPRLVAVCVVHQLRPDAGNGVTAIDKRPVDGRVRIGRYGVRADVQADRKHHGGLDKALYAYARRTRRSGRANSAATSRPASSARTCARREST